MSASAPLSASQALLLLDSLQAAAPAATPATPSDIRQALTRDLQALIARVLKIEAGDLLPTRAFMDYGLDSIASTEIGALFTERYAIRIPPTVFFEFQNLQSLAGYLLNNHATQLQDFYASAAPADAPTPAAATVASPTPVAVPATAPMAASTPLPATGSLEDLWQDSAAQALSVPPARPVVAPAAVSAADQGAPLGIEALWQQVEQHLQPAGRMPEPAQALLDAELEITARARLLQIQRPGQSRLECAVYGEGRPLLLLGGLVMQFDVMWRLQMRALGEQYRLIMFHLPGCQGAELPASLDLPQLVDDVACVLDELGIDAPLPVIGYSFGGVLAQSFALRWPQRCSALCITVSSPFSEGATNFPVLMRELQKSDRFMQLNRGWNMAALPRYQQVIGDFDLRPQLASLRCPCRIICGSEDAYQPAAFSQQIARQMPQAELIEVAGAGHLLGFTHHERYNQLLLEFLHSLPAQPNSTQPATPTATGTPARRRDSRFEPTRARTLQVLADYVRAGEQGHCAILSAPAAQTAVLLNRLCQQGKPDAPDYRSYFMTSLEEALDAALRLARHHARNRNPHSRGRLLLIDSDGYWQRYFNPLAADAQDALVPGVEVVASLAAARQALAGAGSEAPAALVLISAGDARAQDCDALFASLAGSHTLAVLVEQGSEPDGGLLPHLRHSPDLLVFGECISGNQAAVSACLVSGRIENPWLMTPNESYVRHVMTSFGFSLQLASDYLQQRLHSQLDATCQQQLRLIAASPEATYQAHLQYGNSGYARVARLHGFDARFYEARGLHSRLRREGEASREIIDCFVNVGTCPRGLNPDDVPQQISAQHDSQQDYWQALASLLQRNTGLPHTLPASSNVTAVESALSLGLLAAPAGRRKLLCFSGGLGFSLLSAASSHAPDFDIFRQPFLPLYAHSLFIDPASPHAEAQLQDALLSGEVAMVWFESIQVDANASRPLPVNLIRLVEQHRAAGGYLVGIDETQTAVVTGQFLHSRSLLAQPDIVALGSFLCDSLLPMGAVLCSADVQQRAAACQPQRLHDLQYSSRSQLAAHIALNCLQAIERDDLLQATRQQGDYFKRQLLQLQQEFPLLREIRGEGLLLTLELDLRDCSAFVQRSFGYLMWGSMLRDPEGGVAAAVCPIHNQCLRYLPPLNIQRADIDRMIANLRRVLQLGVDGVLLECAAHNERMGDPRTASFLAAQIQNPTHQNNNNKESAL